MGSNNTFTINKSDEFTSISSGRKYELLTSEKYIEGVGNVRVYGISITSDGYGAQVEDISTNANTVIQLLHILEQNGCSPMHLRDVVEDFLAYF